MSEFDFLDTDNRENNIKVKTELQLLLEKRNKSQTTHPEYPDINSEDELDHYLKQLRQKNRYDPRSDIKEDHFIWVKLLKIAEELDYMGYGLLHGLRCAGCRLKVEKGKLMLDLAESTELLELYIDDEKLEELGEPEQLNMFGIKEEELKQRRIENKERTQKKNELEEEAIKEIKSQELQPNLKNLKLIFKDINKWVNEINHKNHGVNLLQLNNILADIEHHKERKY